MADTTNCWCRKASNCLGYKVSKEDIKHDKIVGSVPLSAREIFRLQDEVWQEWEELPPTEEGIPEIILQLKNNEYKVIVATCRPNRSTPLVVKWLRKTGIIYDSFYSLGPYKAKADINCDILVDDSPQQVIGIVKKGKTGLLYAQPWNEISKIPKVIRIHSLAEIPNYLII